MRFQCLVVSVILALLGAVPALASAQDEPPTDPHAGVPGAPPTGRQIATANASARVPAGSIRVTVVDEAGAPVRGAEVNIGLMGAEGRRERRRQQTDATGITTFAGLQTGTTEAYRVNLPYGGALYSSNPFQLPPMVGYDVKLTRLPTTRDPESVLLVHGEVSAELREGRLHITQSAQLMNLAQVTYVFPERGLPIPLPPGFAAPQTEPVMTDQKLIGDDHGYKLLGSLPPGSVVLSWAYDVPLEGAEQVIEFPVPFRTYSYRVITDAPIGTSLDVEAVTRGAGTAGAAPSNFSRAEIVENEGRRLFVSELQRNAQDPALDRVRVHFSGLPTPGPMRWFAVIGALILALAGVYVAAVSGGVQNGDALATRRSQVLEALEALEQQRRDEQVGPRTYEQERERLVTELAAVIRAEEARQAQGARARGAGQVRVSSDKGTASR